MKYSFRTHLKVWHTIIVGRIQGKCMDEIVDESIQRLSKLQHENRKLDAELEELQAELTKARRYYGKH